jgi:hypothetical protein
MQLSAGEVRTMFCTLQHLGRVHPYLDQADRQDFAELLRVLADVVEHGIGGLGCPSTGLH